MDQLDSTLSYDPQPTPNPALSYPTYLLFQPLLPCSFILKHFPRIGYQCLTSQSSEAPGGYSPLSQIQEEKRQTYSGLWSAGEGPVLYGAYDGVRLGSPLGPLRASALSDHLLLR